MIQAQLELDLIRWGMCEAGQQSEIGRIFAELLPQHANLVRAHVERCKAVLNVFGGEFVRAKAAR